jgi:acyl-CoA synthetase (NDP forming)
VAIIGATERPGHAATLHANLVAGGFAGPIYPVNPNRTDLNGVACFATIGELAGKVDLAVLAIRKELVPNELQAAADAGVRAAIIISEGFAETGTDEGRQRQEAVRTIAESAPIAVCGPNCNGLVDTRSRLRVCSAPLDERALRAGGRIAILSQSGANGVHILRELAQRNVDAAVLVSTGNEASLSVVDYIERLVEDPEILVVGAYVEEIRQPERFRLVALQALERNVPLVFLKAGRSDASARVALSHTGALAGSAENWDALFAQVGVIQVADVPQLADVCSGLAQLEPSLRPRGRRLGIATEGGGSAAIAADLAAERGFELADLSARAAERVRHLAPDTMSIKNPLDLIGTYLNRTPELLEASLEALADTSTFDAAVYVVGLLDEMERAIRGASSTAGTGPILVSSVAVEAVPGPVRALAAESRVPVLMGMRQAIDTLAAIRDYCMFSERRRASAHVRAVSLQQRAGGASDRANLLRDAGIPLVESAEVSSAEEAVRLAASFGGEVVLKGVREEIPHKTEYGLVKLGIQSDAQVRDAYRAICAQLRQIDGIVDTETVTVQPFVRGGVEMFVGGSNHDSIGPVVVLGVGGIHLELLRDVARRVAPLTPFDFDEMLDSLVQRDLLFGFREQPHADVAALQSVVLAVSELLLAQRGSLLDLDLNPVVVLPKGQGAVVVDSVVTWAD